MANNIIFLILSVFSCKVRHFGTFLHCEDCNFRGAWTPWLHWLAREKSGVRCDFRGPLKKNKGEGEYGIIWNKLISSVLPTFAKNLISANAMAKNDNPIIYKGLNITNPTSLKDFYRYWDEFHALWFYRAYKELGKLGWKLPEFWGGTVETSKDLHYRYKSTELLPEPWWGNDGTHKFQAVFLNLNPGGGGADKHIDVFKSAGYELYRRYVSRKVDTFVNNKEFKIYVNHKNLKSTTEWLLTQRARPFFNAIDKLEELMSVRNVLGVELIPWHSPSFGNAQKDYLEDNATAIIDYSIKFALTASKEIEGDLRNVVIARVASEHFNKIFSKASNGITIKNSRPLKDNDLLEIEFNGETFYIMPLSGSRNNLPGAEKIKEIFGKITELKNQNNN